MKEWFNIFEVFNIVYDLKIRNLHVYEWEMRVQNLASHTLNSKIISAQNIIDFSFILGWYVTLSTLYFVSILKDKNLRNIELPLLFPPATRF